MTAETKQGSSRLNKLCQVECPHIFDGMLVNLR